MALGGRCKNPALWGSRQPTSPGSGKGKNKALGHNLAIMRYQECDLRQFWLRLLGPERFKHGDRPRGLGMVRINRGIWAIMSVWALLSAFPAAAQENLDLGKTGAQLFSSDCAICHKSPQGLGKTANLEGFLREHYTASKESAALITKYLAANGSSGTPAAVQSTDSDKRSGKESAKQKSAKKPAEAKSEETKSDGMKSKESAKTAKSKDAKSKDSKSKDAKSNGAKPAESGDKAPSESKSEAKDAPKAEPASQAKSETKPEEKSEAKPEAQSEDKPGASPESKPDAQPANDDKADKPN
jgi:mono/diheme cytochrome c family protein